jgi:hypothetical protein
MDNFNLVRRYEGFTFIQISHEIRIRVLKKVILLNIALLDDLRSPIQLSDCSIFEVLGTFSRRATGGFS